MKNNEQIFEQLLKELNFDLTKDQYDYVLNQFNSFCGNLDNLNNLDLSKYAEFNYAPMSYNSLREDEVVAEENPRKHFNNAVNFEQDYVVINDEK